MLKTKENTASKTTSKWWMTTKRKIYTSKLNLLLYSEDSKLKSEDNSTNTLPLSNSSNIVETINFYLKNIGYSDQQLLGKSRCHIFLMSKARTNKLLNIRNRNLKTFSDKIIKKCNINIKIKKSIRSTKKFKRNPSTKKINFLKIFNNGEIIGGKVLNEKENINIIF